MNDIALDVAIIIPIVMLIYCAFQAERGVRSRMRRGRRGKERENTMANELIEGLVGKYCTLTTGAFGPSIAGTVLSVKGSWIEVKTRKGVRLINADYVVDAAIDDKKEGGKG